MLERILETSPVVYIPQDDLAGSPRSREIAGFMQPNSILVYLNGDFETTGSLPPVFLNWAENAGTGGGLIDDETTIVHTGNHSAKLTSGTGHNTFIYAFISAGPGRVVTFNVWCRGDGVNDGLVRAKDSAGNDILASTHTLVTGTTWTLKSYTCNPIPQGTNGAYIRLLCSSVTGGVCYWDDFAYSVSTSDGIPNSGVEFGYPGIGDGRTCARFGRLVPGYIDIFTPYFADAFNDQLGSMLIWIKVGILSEWLNQLNSGVFWRIAGDIYNTITLGRDIYQVPGDINKGGHVNYYWIGDGISTEGYPQVQNLENNSDWLCFVQTWDYINNRHLCYMNGVLKVATNTITPWVLRPVYGYTQLGIYTIGTSSSPWNGYLAHAALWNRELTPLEVGWLSVR